MTERWFDDDGDGADPSNAGAGLTERLRAEARVTAGSQARQLRLAAAIADRVAADVRVELSRGSRVPGQPCDERVIEAAAVDEVQLVLGISRWEADRTVDLALRLTRVLPDTLAALEAGRLDLGRARAVAAATELMSDTDARQVEARVLPAADRAPWEGLSPRAWRARLDRAVIRVDAAAARRRRVRSVAERSVRCWPNGDGTAGLQATASDTDIALAEQVIADLAARWPERDEHGARLSMDQRRVDALIDLFRRVRDGESLPGTGVRRTRQVGIVLHGDTFFGDGPAAADPGQVRGLGVPAPVDPATAAESARTEIARGAGTSVFLTDRHGRLERIVRIGSPAGGRWTRILLEAAIRDTLGHLAPLSTPVYPPTVAITEHVHARNPTCTAYDCPRVAARCDLDHDQPWPRGPTDAANMQPRCPRDHDTKTRHLMRTALHPDGTVAHTTRRGLTVTTRPEPLPGHAPGEGYGPSV